MKLKVYLIVFIAFLFGCASEKYLLKSVDVFSRDLVSKCIEAHIANETGLWDEELGVPVKNELDIIEIRELEALPYYTIAFAMSQPYPDGPHALCQIEKNKKAVIYLSYDIANGKSVEVDLGLGNFKEAVLAAYENDAIQKPKILSVNYVGFGKSMVLNAIEYQ